jgi:hypothetical protein
MQIKGSSTRVHVAEASPVRSQERLYDLVAAESRAS